MTLHFPAGVLAVIFSFLSDGSAFSPSVRSSAPEVGKPAPEITLSDPNGNLIRLSSLRGQVVLLDFWASWCGPCRKENPYTVELYAQYKDKGFTVYSISLDQNKQRWVHAIQADGLAWPNHVSDLKGWYNAAAETYGVTAIPALYLIDRNGVVVAKNVRITDIERYLRKTLK